MDGATTAILDELTERDGQTLFELCARLATKHGMGSTRQAISQHVDVLDRSPGHLRALDGGSLGDHCRHLAAAIAGLKALKDRVAEVHGAMRPGNLFTYITQRKVWNPTGGMKEWLYVKKGL